MPLDRDHNDELPDFEEFGNETWAQAALEAYMHEERLRIHGLPIRRKAEEIYQVAEALAETIVEADDRLGVRARLQEHAMCLGVKISGAEASDLYMLKMQNAVMVKAHATELLGLAGWCQNTGLSDGRYLKVLRDDIEEFRQLFVAWVKRFDKNNNQADGWGLFEE
ncbi:MAG: hypothetical protein MUC97_11050 [Bernardetiaceae bacterium]|jgi:hypothetical protein|nr:hypothetical protein [Bernardetiaceae bacterium]